MTTMEEKVGYLIAKMEEQGNDVKEMGRKLEALEQRVDSKFKTAEATLRVLQWLGSTAVAAVLLPWEKIVKWFN